MRPKQSKLKIVVTRLFFMVVPVDAPVKTIAPVLLMATYSGVVDPAYTKS